MEVGPSESYTDYYGTVAQVVPVLFVLLAIEARTLFEAKSKTLGKWAILFVLAGFLLAMTEVFSLHVLASDATNEDWKWVVGSFLLVGGLLTLIAMLAPERKPWRWVVSILLLPLLGAGVFFGIDALLAA